MENIDQDQIPRFTQGSTKNPYQFSPEELRVLKECNRDSFFQRCIPLGTFFGVSTYYAVKTGFLRSNVKYGATPKVIVAVILGYFMGKFSYQQRCAEKLMQLPNSSIGEMLRQRKRGALKDTFEPGLGPGMALPPFSGVGSKDTYSDLEPPSLPDIDTTTRPDYDDLGDHPRSETEEELPPQHRTFTTYEELRKKNREEYNQKRISNYRVPPPPPSFAPSSAGQEPATDEFNKPPVRTNKYGDAII